ncbi:GIY-YIG nuclease family protein [Melioribacter roseus]|uniref:GIY-YIG nuclease family protein n=1 Tax=Melioribacter roseus TaxID=1134405 RepID=UPI0009DA9564|nr:GIY-YIG nuclease family protein [Melioribacter roseus]
MIFSPSKNRFYVGSTNDIQRRLNEHNSGQTKSTRSGKPWNLVFLKEFNSKSEAMKLEIKIKKRGIKRFLNDIQPG